MLIGDVVGENGSLNELEEPFLREVIKAWTQNACSHTRMPRSEIARKLRWNAGWLSVREQPDTAELLELEEMEELACITGYPLHGHVREARRQLDARFWGVHETREEDSDADPNEGWLNKDVFILREAVKSWTMNACQHSSLPLPALSQRMGQSSSWLGFRAKPSSPQVLTMEQMEKLSALTSYALPDPVREARIKLDTALETAHPLRRAGRYSVEVEEAGEVPQADDDESHPSIIIKRWTRQACRLSAKRIYVLSELMGQAPHWLSNRTSYSNSIALKSEQMEQLSRITGFRISDAARLARLELDKPRRLRRPRRNEGPGIQSLLSQCATVEDEINGLFDVAHYRLSPGVAAKYKQYIHRRFGMGGFGTHTLEQIGSLYGITRERVRQVEARFLAWVTANLESLTLPCLGALLAGVSARPGMPLTAMEEELNELLGSMSLSQALRFSREIGIDNDIIIENARVYGNEKVQIVARSERDAQLVSAVSSGARKLVSYCGACPVADLRTYVEEQTGELISAADLLKVIDVLPGARWLDEGKRWFWFDSDELTPVLHNAAMIISLARRPVHIETMYTGLARAVLRSRESVAAELCDHIPPFGVVLSMLDSHPAFKRTSASQFTLAIDFDAYEHLTGNNLAIVSAMESHGGVMARCDLVDLRQPDGSRIPKNSISVMLYLSPFYEWLESGVYAIRGRRLDIADRKRAVERVEATIRPGFRPPLKGDRVVAHSRVTEASRRHRTMYLNLSEIPSGIAGSYELEGAGYSCILVDDASSARLRALGPVINAAMDASKPGDIFRFEFQLDEKILRWSLLTDHENTMLADDNG